jgi:phage terminase small subunit
VTPTEPHKFTALQLRFIAEYPVDCRKGPAARRAGCSPKNARKQGVAWYRDPHIRAAIDVRLAELAMSADEAIKHTSDIAATRLNDYLKVVEKERPRQVPQPLALAIAQIEEDIAYERELMERGWEVLGTDEELRATELLEHTRWEKHRRMDILRHQMQLERNPDAFRMVAGPPERYEAVEVDLVALAQAETEGRIKKISFTEHGPVVEMYDAQKSLQDLLKVHGRFVQKVELKDLTDPLAQLSDEELEEKIRGYLAK